VLEYVLGQDWSNGVDAEVFGGQLMKRSYYIPFLSALALILLLSGCWNPFKPDTKDKPGDGPKEEILPRTTPQNVLNNLKVYYSVKDNTLTSAAEAQAIVQEYRTILDPNFKFYFLSADVPPNYPLGWWGKEPEAISLDSLLTRRALGNVNDIQLSWNPGPAEPDNRVGAPPRGMHIKVNLILLDVIQGDVTYRVNNGVADFYFAPDPTDTTLYVITEWYDRQSTS